MTEYQNRLNNRLYVLYNLREDWIKTLKFVKRLENKEVENAVTRTCALEMESVMEEIRRLEGMGGDVRKISREPNFSRKAEDALVFDNQGLLNESGIPVNWGEESDLPPVEPREDGIGSS